MFLINTALSFALGAGLIVCLFLICFCCSLYGISKGLVTWFRNNSAPVETVPAVIVRMQKKDNSTVMTNADGSSSVMPDTVYEVCFRTQDGAERTFHVRRSDYQSFREGMRGNLTFQGTRWHGFEPM